MSVVGSMTTEEVMDCCHMVNMMSKNEICDPI